MLRKHLGGESPQSCLCSAVWVAHQGVNAQNLKRFHMKPGNRRLCRPLTHKKGFQIKNIKRSISDFLMLLQKSLKVGSPTGERPRQRRVSGTLWRWKDEEELLTWSRFQCARQQQQPTLEPNVVLNSNVYLFYLWRKTWHTYADYLDKNESSKSVHTPSPLCSRWEGMGIRTQWGLCWRSRPLFSLTSS